MLMRLIFCSVLLLSINQAQAHKASDSYLRLRIEGTQVQVQWDIALRDLQAAINLDDNTDGNISWGELRAQHDNIAAYVLAHITLTDAGQACMINAPQQQVDQHSDGAYTVLFFTADCKTPVTKLAVNYQLFFDIDRQHRGLLQLEHAGKIQSAIFSPDNMQQSFYLTDQNILRQFGDYMAEGIWHISIGYDHILFLVALLLPVVLQRKNTAWLPATSLRSVVIETLKIVSAFTLAHTITLSLAATGVIHLPSRLIEVAIALSVLLAALDNLYPLFRCPRWWVALGFGLIHGFGFATVLNELGLASQALIMSLLAFNIGVETGQLFIVATILPILFLLRQSAHYPRFILGAGSLACMVMATLWMVERAGVVTL